MAAMATVAVDVRLFSARKQDVRENARPKGLVAPGDVITADLSFMRGHGTYVDSSNAQLLSSVAGVIEKVNKLITVRPLKTRYNGEIGDVVIGRIVEVQQRRWKVEMASRLNASLLLSSVNLPGGELRRKSAEDELLMRQFLCEGDLISAEVQSVFADGSLSLHTRSLKYGKLGQGTLVLVSPSLIKRCKIHFHSLPCGVQVILGNNGYVWICPLPSEEGTKFVQSVDMVPEVTREAISRVRNCVVALARNHVLLFDTSIVYAYDISLEHKVNALAKPEVMKEVADLTKQKLFVEV
uniref:Putative exosomal 3'-5' exoribonuclease complex subunit rrp4 n=1 Tax=Amblyomma cajennense TaxID=34607 RepID=A0A023FHB2_AMBCJ